MATISTNPILYEINTIIWLGELSKKYSRKVVLGSIPDEEWRKLAELNIDYIWLMGVWERSPAGIEIARHNPAAINEFKQMLPDFKLDDIAGSPYCVRSYHVDPAFGGDAGLAVERAKLAAHGIRLILDFVPNHVAPDHPWTVDHPEYFIQGNVQDLEEDPQSFLQIGSSVIARGRDPNFPPWADVVQLNAFSPGLRQASSDTLCEIASMCDGLRVDMAMLFINRIFAQTWGDSAGQAPQAEYWPEILGAVKARFPGFLFIAEAYWDTEQELIGHGFDYCYDKKYYDLLKMKSSRNIHAHLLKTRPYQSKLVRFIENHDEQRARTAFPGDAWKGAAFASATLPGIRMFHEGQFEGRRTRISVLLARRPEESPDPKISVYYHNLINLCTQKPIRSGNWSPLSLTNKVGRHLSGCLAWMWEEDADRQVVLINLTDQVITGHLRLFFSHIKESYLLQEAPHGEMHQPSTVTDQYVDFVLDLPAQEGQILTII